MSSACLPCPVCGTTESVIYTGNQAFDVDGRKTAQCNRLNHHPDCYPVLFFINTGEAVASRALPLYEKLYRRGVPGTVRGYGSQFLAERCGIKTVKEEVLNDMPEIGKSDAWILKLVREAARGGENVAMMPLYEGGRLCGLELCAFIQSTPRPGERAEVSGRMRYVIGRRGVYIHNVSMNPRAVVLFTGGFDAVAAACDAFERDNSEFAFASVPDKSKPEKVCETLATAFPGVPVILCSDADASGKKVREEYKKLARLIQLTGHTGKDYREAEEVTRWECLLTEVERAIAEHEEELKLGPPLPKELKPHQLAALFLKKHTVIRDSKGQAYEYCDGVWVERSEADLDACIVKLDDPEETTAFRRREARLMALGTVHRPDRIKWDLIHGNSIPFSNGVLDLSTGELSSHCPENMLTKTLPGQWEGPEFVCPKWLGFLEGAFKGKGDAEERIAALQEFFGYVLLPKAEYKRALIIYGPGDTGKSLVGVVLRGLVGEGRTCSIPLEHMDDQRKLAPIKGALLNLLPELSQKSKLREAGFKALVSAGDAIQIDPKWKNQETYIPSAKHVVLTNALPRIDDPSGAAFRRLLIIGMDNIIPVEQQDPNLGTTLLEELAGITAWAVEGARRLVESRGQWTEPASSREVLEEYRQDQNPVRTLLEEGEIVPATKAFIPLVDLAKRISAHQGREVSSKEAGVWCRAAGLEVTQSSRGPKANQKGIAGYKFSGNDPFQEQGWRAA